MNEMVLTFQETDIVIPKQTLLDLGVKLGDLLIIRPLASQTYDENIQRILDETRGSWSEEDELAFRKHREEMWETWQPRFGS